MKSKNHRHFNYPGLKTIDMWVSLDVLGMSEEGRQDYETKKKAIDLYSDGRPLNYIEKETGIKCSYLYYLLGRCTTIDQNGNCIGYVGLIKGKQIVPSRSNNINKLLSGQPESGSLQALFSKYPTLNTTMRDMIVKGILPSSNHPSRRLTWHMIHEEFLNQCNLLSILPPSFPFCSDSKGKFSLIDWGKKIRAESMIRSASLDQAADMYESDRAPPSHCYERVEVDGHSLDVNWTIEIPSLNGEGIIRFKISRLWLIALIEVKSTAVIGYSISLGRNYNASDVTKAIQNSLVPWKPRNLTISTISYKPDECLPNALIPELAYLCFDEIWLDNAKSHLSNIFFTMLERTVNAVPVFGPKASPNVRPRIELLFDLLEEAGIHCLDGTTGSNSQDKRKSSKDDDRFLLKLDTLLDLIDLLIVRYNTGICPGTTISRNDVLKRAVTRETQIFRRIEKSKRANCMKYSIFEEAVIGQEKGSPILRWKNARYDGLGLRNRTGLIGERVLVMANNDARTICVALLKDGTTLGELQVEKRWRGTAHSISTRTIIKRHMNNNSFISHAADIPLAFRKHMEQEVKNNSTNQRIMAKLQKEQDVREQRLVENLEQIGEQEPDEGLTFIEKDHIDSTEGKKDAIDELIQTLGTAYR